MPQWGNLGKMVKLNIFNDWFEIEKRETATEKARNHPLTICNQHFMSSKISTGNTHTHTSYTNNTFIKQHEVVKWFKKIQSISPNMDCAPSTRLVKRTHTFNNAPFLSSWISVSFYLYKFSQRKLSQSLSQHPLRQKAGRNVREATLVDCYVSLTERISPNYLKWED